MMLNLDIDPSALVQALARLKDIPVQKVVRNASRDFAQAALRETPLAQKSKSEYWKYIKDGKPHFLHESQVASRKKKTGLKKVRIFKGWAKASWLGVFRALGMSLRRDSSRLPRKVETMSYAIQRGAGTDASTTMTDYMHFDRFGKGSDLHTDKVAQAGFALAAKRISTEVNRMLKKQWGGN